MLSALGNTIPLENVLQIWPNFIMFVQGFQTMFAFHTAVSCRSEQNYKAMLCELFD